MSREPNKVRLAQVMRALRGNPLTIKEIARILELRYKMTWIHLKELEAQGKIELHTDGIKPHKYRRVICNQE
jgi:predicted ArsR family transcriptional regulator